MPPSMVHESIWTPSVNSAVAPALKLALEQEIFPLPPTDGVVQLQPAGATIDSKVVPSGVAILNWAPTAGSSPGLST